MRARRGQGTKGSRPSRRPHRIGRQLARATTTAVETARHLGELQLAAGRTVAARMTLLADAAADPRLAGNPEFTRMVTEKVEAATHAATAALPHLYLCATHGARWLSDWVAIWGHGSLRPFPDVASPFDVVPAWRLAESLWLVNAAYGAAMVGAAAELGRAMLRPVHRTASANARRLG